MNDPSTPYHAISHYDFAGGIPFLSRLPRDEDDFATQAEAEEFLRFGGGGILERTDDGLTWQHVGVVMPAGAEVPLVR